MGCLSKIEDKLESWGMDPDDLFAFSAPKTVKIRNVRMGCTHLMIQVAILILVICKIIFVDEGLLRKEQITNDSGRIYMSAMDRWELPQTAQFTGYTGLGKPENCSSSCGRGPDYTLPSYCLDNGGTATAGNGSSDDANETCIFWSSANVPIQKAPNEMFLTSQVGIIDWQPSTNAPPCHINNWTNPACRFRSQDVLEKHYLIPDLEDYSIRISHSAKGRVIDAKGETTKSVGKLIDADGNTFKEFAEAEPYDYMLVSELLQAAGLNKNCRDPSNCLPEEHGGLDSPGPNGGTYRSKGFEIGITIEYANHWQDPSAMSYTLTADLREHVKSRVDQTRYSEDGTRRALFKRHGIDIRVGFDGNIGEFSWENLLLQIISALVLLGIANVISIMIITKCLKSKEMYKHHLYDYSEDFSAHRELPKETLEELRVFAKHANKQGSGILTSFNASVATTGEQALSSTAKRCNVPQESDADVNYEDDRKLIFDTSDTSEL